VKSEKKAKEPKEPKVKVPKKKADEPKHNHGLEEEGVECDLCESHGSLVDPEMTEKDFEATVQDGEDIRNVLKNILKSEESEEVPEPEPTPEIEESAPEPTPEIEESAPKFVRPKMKKRGAKAKSPEPEMEAGPSKEVDFRSKLRMLVSQANGEDEEELDEEDVKSKLTKKLAERFDHDSDEEMDFDQMCDSPTSVSVLQKSWAEMTLEEEEEEE
jgi:hypothetical protein